MFFKSFFDEKLAQMSYMIACQQTGEALVIDPARDITPYLETAQKEGFTITGAAETHIHADFTSGVRELANRLDVKLYFSDEGSTNWKYQNLSKLNHQLLKDRDLIRVGKVKLEVMHTPGHTPESLSYLLTDEGGGSEVPMGIFTGDFVFVGDVGRPDLLEKAAAEKGTAEESAKEMYHSLKRFAKLPDYVQVWPGHGAGSACGKSLGAVPSSTVGYEKINNWALNVKDEATFVANLLDGQPEPPKYFAEMKKLNKQGPKLLGHHDVKKVSLEHLNQLKEENVNIVDTRSSSEFANGHVEGTLNIPFNQSFTNWAGWLLDYDKKIAFIADSQEVEAVQKALQSIGLDEVSHYMEKSELEKSGSLESYESISVEELEEKYKDHNDYVIIDVRNQSEWDAGHMEKAKHIMLGTLPERLDEIGGDVTPIVHCQSGMRSAIAVSVMQANGFKNVLNLTGGYAAWNKY
ncbi:rhodanese-like domain-containing protein [Halobacillus rhizosphaerae]|uniref:MBL fold metallo-hydrolase n=1 Tax=Halobacillus rhizosphaerae TaxID=3064889 RepID=UPI00398BAEC2